jgi:hypothetical protein
MNTNGLLLEYVQKSYPQITNLEFNNDTGIYNFLVYDEVAGNNVLADSPTMSAARALANDFNTDLNGVKTKALTNFQVKATIAIGEDLRTRRIKDIKTDVIIKLMEDMATYSTKLAEVKAYLKEGRDHIESYRDFDDVQDLIDFTNDPATHTSHPVLLDEYTTGQTIAQFIAARLAE